MKTLADYRSEAEEALQACSPEVQALFQRVKASELYPPFLEKLLEAQEALVAAGHHVWVTQAERTWEEQHALYLKGRRGIKGEGIVTKVDAGDSAHNYAVAADGAYDLDPEKKGLQPSWDKPQMKTWADAGVAAGLDAGFYWSSFMDGPHLQLNLRSKGLAVKHLKAAYKKGGKLAVFQLLDKYSW